MVSFDLALRPQNIDTKLEYALMIITTDQDGSDVLVDVLTNGQTQADSNKVKKGVRRGRAIHWIDDVEALLDPIRKDFAVYDTVIFNGN